MASKIVYEPALAEEAVFLEDRRRSEAGNDVGEREYREGLESIYRLQDPRQREARFREHALAAFTTLGLDRPVREALEGFPGMEERVSRVLVMRVAHPREEAADLSTGPTEGLPQAGVRLTVGRFSEPDLLRRLLCHEFLHLEDLLDPAFGAVSGDRFGGSPARRRLREDRYREAWAVSVDARLSGEALYAVPEHWGRFRRLFGALPEGEARALFETLLQRRPSHEELKSLADLGNPEASALHTPGGPCPLCQFPTHGWTPAGMLARIARRVHADYPHWAPESGLCGRCAERYEFAGAMP